ncbi:MAG: branched-chain amino acid ABC transporter permease [Oscillospiraceae bacterium]|nr:branched-chain amino acid ABC transporter permease [Oscillospiraceae bacterium]
MKYNYKGLENLYKPEYFKRLVKHPLFAYIILTLILVVVQLLHIFGDGIITLSQSRGIAMAMIYGMAAMGLGVLVGLAGLVSLGTAAFLGLGAYLAGNILRSAVLPFTVLVLIVAAIAIVLGIVIGFISLRVRGLNLLVITLAIATIFNELFLTPNDFTGGVLGISQVPFPEIAMFLQLNRETVFFLILAVQFVLILLTLNIIRSPMGRAMMAMANSEALARAMGVNILKYRVLAFVIATVYAMVAGILFVSTMGAATPGSWTLVLALNMLTAVILGGTAKPAGVLIGAFIIFALDLAVLRNFQFFTRNPMAPAIFSGILIILIVAKYPGGLMKLMHQISGGIKLLTVRWREYRYGPEV